MKEDHRETWRILLRIDVIIVVIDHDSGKMRRMMRKKIKGKIRRKMKRTQRLSGRNREEI